VNWTSTQDNCTTAGNLQQPPCFCDVVFESCQWQTRLVKIFITQVDQSALTPTHAFVAARQA
jgi:hypothetical protein